MMSITVAGSVHAGPSWVALQAMLESMLTPGRLTRIARREGGANYRATAGVYDLTYTPDSGDETVIELRVNS